MEQGHKNEGKKKKLKAKKKKMKGKKKNHFQTKNYLDGRPGYIVLPPDNTMNFLRVALRSTSQLSIESKRAPLIPIQSRLIRSGEKRHSAAMYLSLPKRITRPSGSY